MMCIWRVENNWSELKVQMKQDDILVMSSLQELADKIGGLREKLLFCKETGIQISLGGICLEEKVYMDLLAVIEKEERLRREALKKAQKRGIEEALALSKQGKGRYGRPRADIPEDFEEQIRYLKRNNLSLDSYRKSTNMKKSTFYKYAKLVFV